MRRFITFIYLLMITSALYASTYLKTWVNGVQGSTLTQGDPFAWEFDLSQVGGTGHIQFIMDKDGSGTYTAGDIILIEFDQEDGGTSNDGPSDSSATPDGKVYSDIGPFGFTPASYLFIVTDTNDESVVSASFAVNELLSPAALIDGLVSKSDVDPPSSDLANIMVLAQLEDGFAGYWTGITNEYGAYTINLPAESPGQLWQVELFSDDRGAYTIDDHYKKIIKAGVNTGFDFEFKLATTFVTGRLMDDKGDSIHVDDYIIVERQDSDERFDSEISDGQFNIPVSFDNSQDSAEFYIYLWGEQIPADYMIPGTRDNPDYRFRLHKGDTLEKNMILPRTNGQVYFQVYQDDQPAAQLFKAEAYNENLFSRAVSNENGFGAISILDTGFYHVMLRLDDDNLPPLPQGYTLSGSTNEEGAAGDTVKFYLVPAPSSISGRLIFADDDPPQGDDRNQLRIIARDSSSYDDIRTGIDDSLRYHLYMMNGSYELRFEDYNNNYLVNPQYYDWQRVENEDLRNMDFTLNRRHAEMRVIFKNAPFDINGQYWEIHTKGIYPDVYKAEDYGDSDSSYTFYLCDGDWRIQAPCLSDSGGCDSMVSIISVSNFDEQLTLEIDYKSGEISLSDVTAIAKEPVVQVLDFNLQQNYPNPFNPVTTINYQLPKSGLVKLSVYDITGRLVKSLVNSYRNAGHHAVTFDGSAYASGIYFYRIESGSWFQVKRMVLIK